jgi:predicted RecB family endonuclease
MVELITTILLLAGSIVLLLYWFRYTCLLMLSARTAHDYARDLAPAYGLQIVDVQDQLNTSQAGDLARLHAALEHDYAIVQTLLNHGVDQQSRLQNQMLGLYYRTARVWYAASGSFSPSAARRALEEMATVVAHLANTAGEAAAAA